MRTNILTIYNEPNYGACLQAYALYRTVEELGGNPRMIQLSLDYRSRAYTLRNRLLLPVYRLLKGYAPCFAKAEQFSREHNPNQTQKFFTEGQLASHKWNPDDVFMVGSDQVWNPSITSTLRKAYCLNFLPETCTKKSAYASSFGHINDEAERARQLDMESLASFKKIGVREAFGCEFLKHHGIASTEVVDPTLLRNDYHELIKGDIRPREEILFLALSDTAEQQRFVDELSVKLGLPVRKVYGYLQPSRSANKRFLPVEGWLKAIAEAKVVVTDSFHASVFSILFHRQFYVFISQPSKAFRISNLLGALGISSDRIVASADEVDKNNIIDYTCVDARLAQLRASSLQFLKSIIDENRNL